METKEKTFKSLYLAPAFGGSAAGMLVVTAVYPLDTLKTRLQSAQGFKNAGGFRGVYKGLLTSLTGTAAMTGIFFLTYETIKQVTEPLVAPQYLPMVHMFGASFCEVVTCLVRVPTDIAKQRKQTFLGNKSKSAISILVDAYKKEGLRRGVYRGFTTTVLRDLPFSFIELPVWELLKTTVKKHNHGEISSFQSGVCGAFAGGFAAIMTTPLDVAKTRIMLAGTAGKMTPELKKLNVVSVIGGIYTEKGIKGLFAGVTPRLTIILFGGFAFLDFMKSLKGDLKNLWVRDSWESGFLENELKAAGVAAMIVSTIVYPLDTLKTRIQSVQGFEKAGGFRGVYKGLMAMISASVPINCFFFGAYETIKNWTEPHVTPQTAPMVHLLGASLCRVMVCLIRVPSEIVKQRKQIFLHEKTKSAFHILFHAYKREGIRHGLYRGFASTVIRDLPYSLIEIPSWELLKNTVARNTEKEITSFQSAVCGMLAGGIAGSITTPFDLAKTRIMLADVKKPTDFDKLRIKIVLANIYLSAGFRGLFAGIYLRTAMVMMGRFMFFGIYEEIKNFLNVYICDFFLNPQITLTRSQITHLRQFITYRSPFITHIRALINHLRPFITYLSKELS